MRIAVFSPYGNSTDADLVSSNFIFLLSSYLHHHKSEVVAIKCDGCLERCSLDFYNQVNHKRPCVVCMNSQKTLISWSSLKDQALSKYLNSEDLKRINQNFADSTFLENILSLAGVELLQKYSQNFAADQVALSKLQKTALSLAISARRLVTELKPKLLLTHSNHDLLTGILALSFADQGVTVASYQTSASQEELTLSTNKNTQTLTFPFYSSNIQHFRSDPNTWDEHLREAILQNVSFLGLQSNQLSFYI